MNVVTRGIKNALRGPLRAGAIILMLAISIALIVSMLVARASINSKIEDVKATAGTSVTITPAGIQGFNGGGDPLTNDQVATITKTEHITSVVLSLSDQLGTDDTNLEASLELGSFGQRQQRFSSDTSPTQTVPAPEEEATTSGRPAMTPRTTVTGTTDPNSIATAGGALALTSGETIDGNSSEYVALVGSGLAEKNDLSVGDTFVAYEKTFTVKGIYKTGNNFQDSGVIMPITVLQTVTGQDGAVTSISATVDSSDNVSSTVATLEAKLGESADITSDIEQANQSVSSLEGIAGLALVGVIGAAAAGAVIILLSMIMIVRERRREIGVIKAIGGTNKSVITQFMSEALTLTIIGGLIGLVLGILVSGPMTQSLVSNNSSNTSTEPAARRQQGSPRAGGMGGPGAQVSQTIGDISSTMTPATFFAAIGITLLIAVLGSALPAWIIANIKPAEVLRSE